MTKKEILQLLEYLYTNQVILEDNLRQLQNNVRFRNIDVADCMELICALQRLDTFKEISNHIRIILKIG